MLWLDNIVTVFQGSAQLCELTAGEIKCISPETFGWLCKINTTELFIIRLHYQNFVSLKVHFSPIAFTAQKTREVPFGEVYHPHIPSVG